VDVVFLGRRAGVPHKTRFLVVLLLENVTQLRVVIGVGISRGDEVPVGQNLWGILLVVGTLGKDKAWRWWSQQGFFWRVLDQYYPETLSWRELGEMRDGGIPVVGLPPGKKM
jgi:hypothetical protein